MVENCSYFLSSLIPPNLYVLGGIALLLVLVIVLHRGHTFRLKEYMAVLLMIIGAVGNGIDRYFDGCVTDYLDFFGLFMYNHFDIMVCVGAAYLFIYSLFLDEQSSTNRRQ